MTKIKDLVTANVDCAFRLFPIDSERYELGTTVLDLIHVRLHHGEHATVQNLKDTRLVDFLNHLEKEFAKGAIAYADYLSAESLAGNIAPSLAIAYWRVKNALPEAFEARCIDIGLYRECVRMVHDVLWLTFFYKLTQRPRH